MRGRTVGSPRVLLGSPVRCQAYEANTNRPHSMTRGVIGSTADSGSVGLGSSPGGSAEFDSPTDCHGDRPADRQVPFGYGLVFCPSRRRSGFESRQGHSRNLSTSVAQRIERQFTKLWMGVRFSPGVPVDDAVRLARVAQRTERRSPKPDWRGFESRRGHRRTCTSAGTTRGRRRST
jgi:hypothetical protein